MDVVRLKCHEKVFYVICNAGTVDLWRKGLLPLQNILKKEQILVNAVNGQPASNEDLRGVFGCTDQKSIIQYILEHGDLQVISLYTSPAPFREPEIPLGTPIKLKDLFQRSKPLNNLAETEAWTHPRHQDVTGKIQNWRLEVFRALTKNSNSKPRDTSPNIFTVGPSFPSAETGFSPGDQANPAHVEKVRPSQLPPPNNSYDFAPSNRQQSLSTFPSSCSISSPPSKTNQDRFPQELSPPLLPPIDNLIEVSRKPEPKILNQQPFRPAYPSSLKQAREERDSLVSSEQLQKRMKLGSKDNYQYYNPNMPMNIPALPRAQLSSSGVFNVPDSLSYNLPIPQLSVSLPNPKPSSLYNTMARPPSSSAPPFFQAHSAHIQAYPVKYIPQEVPLGSIQGVYPYPAQSVGVYPYPPQSTSFNMTENVKIWPQNYSSHLQQTLLNQT